MFDTGRPLDKAIDAYDYYIRCATSRSSELRRLAEELVDEAEQLRGEPVRLEQEAHRKRERADGWQKEAGDYLREAERKLREHPEWKLCVQDAREKLEVEERKYLEVCCARAGLEVSCWYISI